MTRIDYLRGLRPRLRRAALYVREHPGIEVPSGTRGADDCGFQRRSVSSGLPEAISRNHRGSYTRWRGLDSRNCSYAWADELASLGKRIVELYENTCEPERT